jgi:hypothetical protein
MSKPQPSREVFFALMQRYCQLGRLLPQGDETDRDIALADPDKRAEVELILAEMRKIQAEMDAVLDAARAEREGRDA